MKITKIINFILACVITVTSYAAAPEAPLKVAVNSFAPPFVIQSGNNQLFGFDIDMMLSICKTLNRPCQLQPMPFHDLLDAVATNKVDIAVGSIIITPQRETLVNFSSPYLISYSRFLGPAKLAGQPFSLDMLNGKSIGIEAGSAFADELNALGVQNANVVRYDQLADVIVALRDGKVDVAFMDAPTANYWQMQSSGAFVTLGQPVTYGMGLGIAVNKSEPALLNQINSALMQYKNSEAFKQSYERYLAGF